MKMTTPHKDVTPKCFHCGFSKNWQFSNISTFTNTKLGSLEWHRNQTTGWMFVSERKHDQGRCHPPPPPPMIKDSFITSPASSDKHALLVTYVLPPPHHSPFCVFRFSVVCVSVCCVCACVRVCLKVISPLLWSDEGALERKKKNLSRRPGFWHGNRVFPNEFDTKWMWCETTISLQTRSNLHL